MTWFVSGRRKQQQADHDKRLAEAEQEVARIRERAEKVAGSLERRLGRNYWSTAAVKIARREH